MRAPKPLPASLAQFPFTVEQARSRGISRRRTRADDLWKPSRGIRVPKAAQVTLLDMCRPIVDATPNGFISHLTAARIHDFYLPERLASGQLIDVSKPLGEGRPRRIGVHGRQLQLGRRDLVVVTGVRVTGLERTLLDLAPLLTVDELVAIADQLVCEHHRSFGRQVYPQVSLSQLNAYIEQHNGFRDVRKLRAAMKLVRVGSDSARESLLRLIIERSQLPTFLHNVEIKDASGVGKVGPDLGCEEYKTCAEYDGSHHFTAKQQGSDHDRDYITKELGWHQVLINNEDIRAGELVVVTKIARALKLGGWPDPLNLAGRSLEGLLGTRKDYS